MVTFIIHAVISVFAVMNPLGNVPIFLSLTEGTSVAEQRRIARKGILIAFVILTIFIVLGHIIFQVFGITVAAFRVAGGILIFGIAYNLMQAKHSHAHAPHPEEHVESAGKDDISVTPLAIPLIAGPGTIATVMGLSSGGSLVFHSIAVFIGVLIVLGGTYIIFYYSGWIHQHLGKTEMNVITRLMGLLLAIIAVQMAATGLGSLFPGLLHK
ncbi:MarC family protein [Neobacillus fumarioli]|uniref:MarC family protein n=1 Tax=Neobacillus fumarioli TaxID=105229 RepID=UPI00082E0101|nr:MarC family protein [Neobacillus fumarioli]